VVDDNISFVEGYSLRYDWDNFEMLCDELGLVSLEDIVSFYSQENIKKIGLKQLRIMVWAGLYRPDKPLKKDEVGQIISTYLKGKTLGDLIELLVTAQVSSGILGEPNGETKGEAEGDLKKKPPRQLKS
jgi:hypothetical protein